MGAENRDGVTIFNYKLATNQLLHRLLDQLPKESPWAAAEACQECGSRFSLTMRKHHWLETGFWVLGKCSVNLFLSLSLSSFSLPLQSSLRPGAVQQVF